MSKGSLTILGTGIEVVSHITFESLDKIKKAAKLFYLVNDKILEEWLLRQNPGGISLAHHYKTNLDREKIYSNITSEVSGEVIAGNCVTLVFYGHPCVFVRPMRLLINALEPKGHQVKILPAVSALDALLADLKAPLSTEGLQNYEATDLVLYERHLDPRSPLVIWQAGTFANIKVSSELGLGTNQKKLIFFINYLQRFYDGKHTIMIYDGSIYPGYKPEIKSICIKDLNCNVLTPTSTLYIPPSQQARINKTTLKQLGLSQ